MRKKLGLLLIVTLSLLGCADGTLNVAKKHQGVALSQSAPIINSFAADPAEIDAAGDVTLSWDVSGADTVEITSDDATNPYHYSTDTDYQSSTQVPVSADTTFILTATQNSKDPKGEPISVQSSVEVKAKASHELAINFYAEEATVKKGAKTVLHWSVTPSSAKVLGIDASTDEIPVQGPCSASTTEEVEDQGDAAPAEWPDSGCASVTPSGNTTYTLKVELDGEEQTKEVDVTVSGNAAPTITLTQAASSDLKNPGVVLSWTVSDKTATVTLSASPEDALMLPAGSSLPVDAAVDENGSGSFTIQMTSIKKMVTFTAIAKVGTQTVQSQTVSIQPTIASVDCSQFAAVAEASGPVFMKEVIRLTITAPQAGTIAVTDNAGGFITENAVEANQPFTTMAGARPSFNVVYSQNGNVACPAKQIIVPMVTLKSIGDGAKSVRVAGVDPKNVNDVYVGLDKGSFNNGHIAVAHYKDMTSTLLDIDLVGVIKGTDSLTKMLNDRVADAFQNFPVNAVTMSPAGRLFVGSSGGIVYQDGDKWMPLTYALRANDGSYSGENDTCFGMKQKGIKPKIKGEVVALGQYCDVLATSDGKLYIATDHWGVSYLDNVEDYIKSDKKNPMWKGRKNELNGMVVNDIEAAGGALYAATDKGVYTSTNGGDNWSQVSGMTQPAFSLALFQKNGSTMVAASIDGGVILSGSAKIGVIAGRVYSVVADPYDPMTLYAGGDSGFYVSRDGGNSFRKVDVEGDSKPIRSIRVAYSADPKGEAFDYSVYIATEKGVLNGAYHKTK